MKSILMIGISIFLISISIFFALLYLNLLSFGYSFLKYVYFISRRGECFLFLPGIVFLYFGLKKKGK